MKLISSIQDLHPEMTTWRQDIHAHPETAFEEIRTSEIVQQKLKEFGIEVHTGLAKTGVVGVIRNGEGPSIGLRADMDALDVLEKNTFDHKSVNHGKMHACGHDGHTATLLGAAKYLAATRKFKGTVNFIFQPAEEGKGGAREMVEGGLFKTFPMDVVFGLHNWPGMPVGHVGVRPGPLMAASDSIVITLNGQGCHAGMPHLGTDTVLAAAELVTGLQKIVSRSNPLDNAVVSITQFHAGESDNIIPDTAVLRGTARSFTEESQDYIEASIRRITEGVALAHGIEGTVQYERQYPPTVNSPKETEFAIETAREILGPDRVDPNTPQTLGAEDFSFFLKSKPGCYIFLGNGPGEGGCILHNPHYDFNDEILPIGATYFARLVERYCPA